MRAILTFSRGWNALVAARSLGRRGIEVIAGDEYQFSPTSFSKYTIASFLYPSPDRDPEGFLDKLEEIIRQYARDGEEYVLMPFHKETYVIAQNRARFEPLIKMAIPTIEQILQVDDKGSLARMCQERKLPMPATIVSDSPDEFRRQAEGFTYPAFVKVRRSAAAVGVKQVHNAAEAIAAADEFANRFHVPWAAYPLLQPAVPGDDYCTTFLFDHGQPRATMTYHNLRTYPVKSGTGVLRETVDAPAMERTGAALLGSLGWHGVAEVDFRWQGGAAEPLLIEVNPRFWGGLPQSVASGWDYPYLLYRLAVDGTVAPVDPHSSDVKTETPVMALLATLEEIVSDNDRFDAIRSAYHEWRATSGQAHRLRSLGDLFESMKEAVDAKQRWERARSLLNDHRHTVSDVWSWHDPLPALGVLYPLAVFMKNGKVSTELLVSEEPVPATK
ncbi:MAG: ATP-grasp domain-containing protein [Planctomycetes bacterium]|nr:ATP-grasp domain-containing protein [Planctomycetota bacterium]